MTEEVKKGISVQLTFEPMKGLGGGLRSEWLTGNSDEKDEKERIEFGIDSGAGLNNPYLTFWIKKGGKRTYYTADVRELARGLVKAVS